MRELYSAASLRAAEDISLMKRNMRQYLGSHEIDGSGEPASYVRNVTYELIEGEVDAEVPYPKADAKGEGDGRLMKAMTIERLCRVIRGELPFEELNERDERYTYIYGASVWYVEWDSTIPSGGGVRVHCLEPDTFIGQPGVVEVEDMEYCFLRFTTTRGELIRRYGLTKEEAARAEVEFEYGSFSIDEDTVTLIIAFYRDADGEIGRLIFSGEVLISDMPRLYKRRIEAVGDGGYREIDEETVITESGELTLPYYTPSCYPIVIRRNTATKESVYGLSDCELIRDQQQAINKLESRILKKLLRAGVYPVMPEDASVSAGNSVFGEIIRMRPGESTDSYGTIDTTPDVSEDILAADRLYEQARRILGITDALAGTETAVSESGYARELKLRRASTRLETKRRIKYHTYSRIYELIFKHYLAFSDGKITVGEGGECFERRMFIECDNGVYRYSDDYIFSVDLDRTDEYGRAKIWERNLEELKSGSLGAMDKASTLRRYWMLQEKAGYPFAKENVGYFDGLIEKENQE